MPRRLAPLALLILPGCVAALPAAPYVTGAATTAAVSYLGDATFAYAGRRLSVEAMTCPELRAAYAATVPRQSILVNRWTDWLTTRGMMEDQAEDLGCPLAAPAASPASRPSG
jgi:hypothetical protein